MNRRQGIGFSLGLALLAFFLSTTLLFASGEFLGGDALGYFAATDSLARFGTLDGTPINIRKLSISVLEGPHGGLYSRYPLGQSLIQLPLYWVAVQVAVRSGAQRSRDLTPIQISRDAILIMGLHLTSAFLAGLTALLLFHLLRFYFGFTPRLCFLVCCIYTFGTVAFSFSKTNYSEPVQATLLMALLYWSLCPRGTLALPLLSFVFSLLVLTKPALVPLFPIFAYLTVSKGLWRRSSATSVVASLLIVASFTCLFFYWNYIRTGNILHVYGGDPREVYDFDIRSLPPSLYNLLLSPYKNLFLFNPVLVLALPGLILLRSPTYKVVCAALWVVCLVVFGTYGITWGSSAWGPRYLMPLTVTLMPFVAATLDRIAGLRGVRKVVCSVAATAIVAGSVYVSILGASYSWFHTRHLCWVYETFRKTLPAPECDEHELAMSAVAIHHYLFWKATPAKLRQGSLEEFPWLDDHAYAPTLATRVLSRLGERWLQKDFLFFNLPAFVKNTTGPGVLACGLGAAGVLSLAAIGALTHNAAPREGAP